MGGDNFEQGVFWELYRDLERQFEDFLGYVPYLDGNEKVYSFKLLNLILSICGHIDSAFKEMARYPRFSERDSIKEIRDILEEQKIAITNKERVPTVPFHLCLKAFDESYKISQQEVLFKRLPKRQSIRPFELQNQKAPVWWDIYNGLKHDASYYIKNANLENTVQALAGALLLNVVHEPAVPRLFQYGVVKVKECQPIAHPDHGATIWHELEPTPGNIRMIESWVGKGVVDKFTQMYAETPLFIYHFGPSQGLFEMFGSEPTV